MQGEVIDPGGRVTAGDLLWTELDDPFDEVDWDAVDAQREAPFDPYDLHVPSDPLDVAVAALRVVDRQMAKVLRAVADAGPADGLPARRHIGLRAQATGIDVGFLDRAVQTLAAMPLTWQAFDEGRLSWSQLRGIVLEARRLSVARREVLDGLMVTLIDDTADGEPDRLVEVCGDLVARLDRDTAEADEAGAERSERLVVQLGLDGWGHITGDLAPETTATVCEALDAAADAPVDPDPPPLTDDDGQQLPRVLQPRPSRGRQLAEALHRVCTRYLSGGTGRARPQMLVVAPLADLVPAEDGDDGAGSVTARLLLRTATGRRRITRALTRRLAEDATVIPVFTDVDDIPVAVGDSFSQITEAMRRAVTARDQGCPAVQTTGPRLQRPRRRHRPAPRHPTTPGRPDGGRQPGRGLPTPPHPADPPPLATHPRPGRHPAHPHRPAHLHDPAPAQTPTHTAGATGTPARPRRPVLAGGPLEGPADATSLLAGRRAPAHPCTCCAPPRTSPRPDDRAAPATGA